MIRVIQRRLIIPRGDTGTFTLPLLPGTEQGDIAVFSIYDPLKKEVIYQRQYTITKEELNIPFAREDTLDIEPSNRYEWDVKIYHGPVYADGTDSTNAKTIPINGASINSYYSAFSLPACEIREFS
jgi:hypothetical protein